jgi:hypothetical protein
MTRTWLSCFEFVFLFRGETVHCSPITRIMPAVNFGRIIGTKFKRREVSE